MFTKIAPVVLALTIISIIAIAAIPHFTDISLKTHPIIGWTCIALLLPLGIIGFISLLLTIGSTYKNDIFKNR